ncbi:TerD family protein [Streptomyces sp. SPB074]|uniref:TerD family protein n=1 Tax=Streptomyces sp. (strain SPB074) TaxID=465543 RepID=UPI00017F0E60|nr:TerD family protein [Streptomyces sp. SPB074]EDY43922.1 tellurium resistance protein [Streptomyces sp. SPB074]
MPLCSLLSRLFGKPPQRPAADPTPSGTVTLTKGGSTGISLRKTAGRTVDVHLDWDGGDEDRRARGADLELYVLAVPRDAVVPVGTPPSEATAIYYRQRGTLDAPPYIRHHGDSRTPGRETVTIGHLDQQGYALVCAYSAVSNGIGSFRSYGARVTVTDHADQTVHVPLYKRSAFSYWAAIALLDFTGPEVVIRQVEKYGAVQSEARPVLLSDGRIRMNDGPIEFK